MEIAVRHLKKSFKERVILNDISFKVNSGDIFGLLAPDGSGKTTLMQLLASYLTPDQGEILFNGIPYQKSRDRIKKRIGYLAESNPLFENMTVHEFLTYIAHLCRVPRYVIPTRIIDTLSICSLEREKGLKIKNLSKGQKRMVGISQAIINNPKVLLLDEPTAGLDPNQSENIRKLIKKIAVGKTLIVASHQLTDIKELCDRVIIINKGLVVADGSREGLQNDINDKDVIKLQLAPVSSNNAIVHLKQIEGIRSVEMKKEHFIITSDKESCIEEKIFNLCKENGWYIKNLSPVRMSLEEIFRSYTK